MKLDIVYCPRCKCAHPPGDHKKSGVASRRRGAASAVVGSDEDPPIEAGSMHSGPEIRIPPIESPAPPSARVAQRKERKVPDLEAASSIPAASARAYTIPEVVLEPSVTEVVFVRPDADAEALAILARIREKTRNRVAQYRARKAQER